MPQPGGQSAPAAGTAQIPTRPLLRRSRPAAPAQPTTKVRRTTSETTRQTERCCVAVRIYFRIVATVNFVAVQLYLAGLSWVVWPLFVTTIVLFSDGLAMHYKSKYGSLFTSGALFNFLGVASAALTGNKPLVAMATIGSILLLGAYWIDRPEPPSESADENSP